MDVLIAGDHHAVGEQHLVTGDRGIGGDVGFDIHLDLRAQLQFLQRLRAILAAEQHRGVLGDVDLAGFRTDLGDHTVGDQRVGNIVGELIGTTHRAVQSVLTPAGGVQPDPALGQVRGVHPGDEMFGAVEGDRGVGGNLPYRRHTVRDGHPGVGRVGAVEHAAGTDRGTAGSVGVVDVEEVTVDGGHRPAALNVFGHGDWLAD